MNDLQEKTENRIKKTAILVICLLAAGFFGFAVFGGVFGGTVWDRGMYAVGALLFAVIMSVWIRQLPICEIVKSSRETVFRVDALQICCFACICLMTLYYYNSASEYGHSIATRVMNSAFGIALLAMYRREELHQKWIQYAQGLTALLFMAGTFLQERDAKQTVMYVLTGLTVCVYVQLLCVLAVRIRRKEIRTRFSGYGWLVFLFFAGIVLFRNTRTWPFSVAVPFTCLYLYRFDQVWINRLLKNFCYGCILAFWLMFGSGALFRPYYSFEFVRYPGWFSSVATAGLFWMLVFACTLCCILAKYEGRGSIRRCLFELATLGAAGTYLLLGMSRTSLLGTAVVCAAAFFLSELVRYRDSLREMALKIVLVICPVLLVFPVVYTVVRCIPAVTGRPMWITRAEWFSDRIRKDEPMDSSKYMNVPQLAESLLEKLLGIDINLSAMAGAVSGPGNGVTIDEDGNMTFADNVVDYYIADNGQIYTTKDYTFTNENTEDVSNGRFDIFKLYFENLNLTGHDSMIVENAPEDIILYHAHNSYMQVAYDHGVPVGILFVLVVTGGLIYSIIYYKKQYREVSFAIFPAVVIVSFMIGGLTEWIFHPSIPIGFAFLIALTPLVSAQDPEKDRVTDSGEA